MEKVTPKAIMRLTTGIWEYMTLLAAVKLGVFDTVVNNKSVQDISKQINSNPEYTEKLLDALVAMKFLIKEMDEYKNAPVSEKFLVKTSKSYYGDFVVLYEASLKSGWLDLDKVISNKIARTNTEILSDPVFTRAMHNNAIAPANVLANLIDFSDKKHLLDIGGGSGAYSIILADKFKNLKSTVVEQPVAADTAQEYINKLGDTDRIKVLEGNYFDADFPEHDAALFAQIFHAHSVEQNKLLIKKVYDKLEKEGTIIIVDFLLNEDKAGPLFPALFNLNMLVRIAKGSAYTISEVESWLKDAGFEIIKSEHLIGPSSIIIGKK